nr:MAG TPA: hypothetical protein [Bacteriophage sp.]
MAQEKTDGEMIPARLRVEFAGDGFQRGFLVFLQLGELLGVQRDFPFQRRAGNAGDILADPVSEFLRREAGGDFQPGFNGELLRGDGGGAAFRVKGDFRGFVGQLLTGVEHGFRLRFPRALNEFGKLRLCFTPVPDRPDLRHVVVGADGFHGFAVGKAGGYLGGQFLGVEARPPRFSFGGRFLFPAAVV